MTQDNSLAEALAGCYDEQVQRLVKERLDAGVPPAEILAECNRGMVELGERFARQDCYIPELLFGGKIMKTVVEELTPVLQGEGVSEPVGKVVMGTVQHDVHDIGKDIVVMLLRGVGFEVIDLGVDVPPEEFVEAIGRHRPAVAGMSVLLTTCYQSVSATVEAVRRAGLREGVSLMVGGAAASELLRVNTGCDFYGKTAVDGVKFAGRLVAADD
jgi:5-methyltetrahydrofolate--homocysteine methyltransferase